MIIRSLLLLVVCALVNGTASADTLLVRQDGTGDFSTIAEALLSANSGDEINVGPGTYAESLYVAKSVSIIADSGPSVTCLDGQNSFRPMEIDGAVTVALHGLMFSHGYADNGSALYIWHQPTVEIEDCVFFDNFATESNAVHARHEGTQVTIRNSGFVQNQCNVHSAALSLGEGGYMLVEGCVFADNVAQEMSGAANCLSAHMDVHNCLFLRNMAPGTGALVYVDSSGEVTGNTFHANSGFDNGSVYISNGVVFSHNIITSEQMGFGLVCSSTTQHSCNLFYDNAAGPVEGSALTSDEIIADPLYCDYTNDDFMLCSDSPAVPNVCTCGLIGAFEEGCQVCGPVAVEERTWSDLKALYK